MRTAIGAAIIDVGKILLVRKNKAGFFQVENLSPTNLISNACVER